MSLTPAPRQSSGIGSGVTSPFFQMNGLFMHVPGTCPLSFNIAETPAGESKQPPVRIVEVPSRQISTFHESPTKVPPSISPRELIEYAHVNGSSEILPSCQITARGSRQHPSASSVAMLLVPITSPAAFMPIALL